MTSGSIQLKNDGAKFWDSNPCGGIWGDYSQYMDWIQKTEPYIFKILDQYDWEDKKVLEVGCGQGATLNYLPRYNASITGLDMSMQSIRYALNGANELGNQDRVFLLEADAELLPFGCDTFDSVICCGVLHHTSDTMGGIRNIFKILKPGGMAIIMLYHSGNPKWWMTRILRGISKLIDFIFRKKNIIADFIRSNQRKNAVQGTALLELFGVPILSAYSNRDALVMFEGFSKVKISNHQAGFKRMVDIFPVLSFLSRFLSWIDTKSVNKWGFYQVIEAQK
jgi:SAM-dependent methyltransferase